jgi:hypothetical protein
LKKILLILKNNNRFDLKGTIKNNNNNNNKNYCYYYYLFLSLVNWKKYILLPSKKYHILKKNIKKYKNLGREVKYYY